MEVSFYVAAQGASANQSKLDTIGNNIANINNDGFKSQSAGFVDMLYDNMNRPSGEATHLKQGTGARVEKTDISFEPGTPKPTGSDLDFAITGDGFFALQNPETGERFYTRKGSFAMAQMQDGTFNLAAENGYFVLDNAGQPIKVTDREEKLPVAVYDFPKKEGFLLAGDNLFSATARNGQAFVMEGVEPKRSHLETSNVDTAKEMSKMIEAQRAYQMALRMVQTSDEVEQTINGLRQG